MGTKLPHDVRIRSFEPPVAPIHSHRLWSVILERNVPRVAGGWAAAVAVLSYQDELENGRTPNDESGTARENKRST